MPPAMPMSEPAGVAPVIREWRVALPGRPALPVFLCAFDAARFDHAMFARFGLDCPEAIGRSVRKRQAEYFFGRYCAVRALDDIGIAHAGVQTGASREPLWPAGAIGSITHSNSFAAAVALPAVGRGGIGIDIEHVVAAPVWDDMHASIVSAPELAYLRGAAGRHPLHLLLTLVFSAKESFYKAVFGVVQRFFDFHAIAVTAIDLERRSIDFIIQEGLCERFPRDGRIQVQFELLDETTVFTVCVW